MDQTQRLISDDDEEDVSLDREKPVANLHMFQGTYGPAQDYAIYPGQNIIGRHASCDITLPAQSVSKKHAILEVQADCHTICDCGSMNKTRRGKAPLSPNVRYALSHGDFVLFADVACRYSINKELEKIQKAEQQAVLDETEDDSLLVPGTQATLVIEKTPGVAIRRMGRGAILARDSGDEEENEEENRRGLSEERKGFGPFHNDNKASTTGTFLSPTTDTFVPESDEENDTSISPCRFPALNLHCDSDASIHETPTRRESFVPSTQSFVTSPALTEKKTSLTTDPGPSSEDKTSMSAPAGVHMKLFDGEKYVGDSLTVKTKEDASYIKDSTRREHGPDSAPIIGNPAFGHEGAGYEKGTGPSGTNMNSDKAELDEALHPVENQKETSGITLKSNVDINDDVTTSNKETENRKSAGIVLHSDSDDEEQADDLSVDVNTKPRFDLRSDTDVADHAASSATNLPSEKTLEVKQSTSTVEDNDRASKNSVEEKVESTLNLESKTDAKKEDRTSVGAGVKERETSVIQSDIDTDVEKEDSISVSACKKMRKTTGIISDSDTDVEEDHRTSVSDGKKMRKTTGVISDSDTDVEEDDRTSVSDVKKLRKTTGIISDSDTDVEEQDESTSVSAGKKLRKTTGIISDSGTDVEEDESTSVCAGNNKMRKTTGIISDSDTDAESNKNVEDDMKDKKAETSEDSDTDVEGNDDILKVDTKKQHVEFNLDSDTDIEDDSINSMDVKKSDKSPSADTEKTEKTTSPVQITVDDRESSKTNVDKEAVLGFHMDSDTDVEESDEDQLTKSSIADNEKSVELRVQTEYHGKNFPSETDQEPSNADVLNQNTSPAINLEKEKNPDEVGSGTAELRMDTDVKDDNTVSQAFRSKGDQSSGCGAHEEPERGLQIGTEKDTAGPCQATETSMVGEEQKKETEDAPGSVDLTIATKDNKPEPEGTDYYMCETQCYLEPEERCLEFPDDDDVNYAEEPTQAFISSTLVEPDPFKRPADPVRSPQISPVRLNTSEEEVDENVVAETQPYFCETDTLDREPIQETTETESESTETPRVTQEFPKEISQEDTQPVSQYLAAQSTHEIVTTAPLKNVVPVVVWEKVTHLKEDTKGRDEIDVAEEATQPYTLDGLNSDGDATQAFSLHVQTTECNVHLPESSASHPSSLNVPTDGLSGPTTGDDTQPCSLGVPSTMEDTVSDKTQRIFIEAESQMHENKEQEESYNSAETVVEKVEEHTEESIALHLSPSFVSTEQEAGDLQQSFGGIVNEMTITDEFEKERKSIAEIMKAADTKSQNTEKKEDNTSTMNESRNKIDVDVKPSTSQDKEDEREKMEAKKENKDEVESKELANVERPSTSFTREESPRCSVNNKKENDFFANEKNEADLSENSMNQSSGSDRRDGVCSTVQRLETDFKLHKDGVVSKKNASEEVIKTEQIIEPDEKDETVAVSDRVESSHSEKKITQMSHAVNTLSVELEKEGEASVDTTTGQERKSEEVITDKVPGREKLKASCRIEEEVAGETLKATGKLLSTKKIKNTREEVEANEHTPITSKVVEEPVSRPISRKTRKKSAEEETCEQQKDKGKSEEEPIGRPASRRTRKNPMVEVTNEQMEDQGKSGEVPVSRPLSRRTKNSTGEERSEQKEDNEKTVSKPPSRRTRKNSTGEKSGELTEDKEHVEEKTVNRPLFRKTRKNSTGEESRELREDKEQVEEEPVNRPLSRRTRKSSSGEERIEQKEDLDISQEKTVSKPPSRRTRKKSTGEESRELREDKEQVEEEPVNRPLSRKTRQSSTCEKSGELTEDKGHVEEKTVNRPLSRKTRKNSAGEGTSNQKEDTGKSEGEPVSKRISRRTRKNSAGEGTYEQKEDTGKSEEEPVRPVCRSTRTNPTREGAHGQKEDTGKPQEVLVGRPHSRRTKKNSTEEETNKGNSQNDPDSRPVSRRTKRNSKEEEEEYKEKTEKDGSVLEQTERDDPLQRSRRTRKNLEDRQSNEESIEKLEKAEIEKTASRKEASEVENVVSGRQPDTRRARKNSTGEEVEKSEVEHAPKKRTSLRGRKNLEEEKSGTVENVAEQDDLAGKLAYRRGGKNSVEVPKCRTNEAAQTESEVKAKYRKPTSRTRRKVSPDEDSDVKEKIASEEEVIGISTMKEEKELVMREDNLKGDTPRRTRTSTMGLNESPQATTPLLTRKRGQRQKDGEVELKRKKSEEGTQLEKNEEGKTSPHPKGKRGRPRRLLAAAEEEDTEKESVRGKEVLTPLPSPAGRSRQKPSAVLNSPAEVQTPRRTNRSTAVAGSSSPYIAHHLAAPKVLFTGVVDSDGEETIRSLGGDIADSVFDCTHLVTDRVRRTVKFLCALARGIPIITLDWIEKCKKSGCFLSPDGFLVNDKEQEKNFNFVLCKSLQKAKRKALFEGYEIHVTANVKPEPEHMKDIIRCSGATFLPKLPRTYKEKCVIVSCQEDATRWRGVPSSVPITSAEFILSGILQQEANPAAYLLNDSTKDAAPTPAKRRR
ncbi:mediator of DNA damage checkpoint 1 [Pelobates cultripes]|uniref:Mediator of DNA damage checkpoint protein 1 n=2 Tax=Pelobates cultripes TaxID=61616 RepID=A0AAD1WMM4_PELCU|nr:mediator of DNA damage checkpoint 1 [Pelobates cultripes]